MITGIVDWARERNIGFSHVVSLGDMADVDFGDMLDYLAADAQCRAILLYMESVTNAPKFMSAARRAARSKPVIVVKSGRSATGAKAALSHTGALAGADARLRGRVPARRPAARAASCDDLFSAAEMLARHPRLARRAARDPHQRRRRRRAWRPTAWPTSTAPSLTLSDATLAALDAALPATWSHGNPVDIIGDADRARYRARAGYAAGEPKTPTPCWS